MTAGYRFPVNLDPEELAGLAAVLSRRFATDTERSGLLEAAGLGGPGDWPALVLRAQQEGQLSRLVDAAARARPDDENLRALAQTLGPTPVPRSAFVAAGGVLILLGVAAAAWYGSADDKINRIVEQKSPPPAAPLQTVAKGPSLRNPAANPPHMRPATPTDTPAPSEPVEVPEPQPAESQPPEPAELVEASRVEGRCGGPRGTLLGYWYAGFPFEASQGQDYTIKNGAFVREDLPRKENHWSSKAPVVCSLEAGDVVHLSESPVLIEGGKYWVPLLAGDLKE